MTLPIITAADGGAWESSLLTRLTRSGSQLSVVRRCVDVVELAAVAGSGQAVAALVDAGLRRLDADVVERIAANGVAVVGVTTRAGEQELDRLRTAGIVFAVPAEADIAVIEEVLRSAVAASTGSVASRARAFGDPSSGRGDLLGGEPPAPQGEADHDHSQADSGVVEEPGRRGKVVAVWGPTGAPGRTTVAVNLAEEIGRLELGCLLVDVDVYGGVVANVLGLLDDSPGLVAACRQAQSNRLDRTALSSLCWQLRSGLRVLTGIARADRWVEVRPAALESVLELARGLADYTVLDLGFALETDEELSFDTIAPRRNGATLAGLAAADLILAVGAGDPVGMQRLIRGLDELRALDLAAPVQVVINQARPGSVAGKPGVELAAALERFAGRRPSAMLPYDRDALDRALVAGKSLAEVAAQSPLRRAVREVAATVVGRQASDKQRLRRR
ncbi:MAG TPA: hypothetical protein VMB79_09745 [Jatrophihabitans sp.]|nr:hypothetical protein [Jatrophihabitans sp.]